MEVGPVPVAAGVRELMDRPNKDRELERRPVNRDILVEHLGVIHRRVNLDVDPLPCVEHLDVLKRDVPSQKVAAPDSTDA